LHPEESGAAEMLGEEKLPKYPEHSRENSQTIAEKIELAMFEDLGISLLIDELANSVDRNHPKVINSGSGLSRCIVARTTGVKSSLRGRRLYLTHVAGRRHSE